MEITTRMADGEAVLAVSGCLDTAATPEFAKVVAAAATDGARLRFDFAGLEFIASSALRQLVSTYKRLKATGGEVTLVGLNDVVRDVFEVTGLDTVFTIR